ncbi:MAG: NAD(P)-dependent oxidoreductase [Phycisphaerales bacterium]
MPAAVAVTEPLTEECLRWLQERVSVTTAAPGDSAFEAVAGSLDGLVVRTLTRVDRPLLERLPRLRVVARAGVGLDNIDLPACRERGIQVVHTPDANTQAVVEYVLCLLCDALRPRLFLDKPVDTPAWERIRSEVCGERQMDELTLGILGFGRIGSRVAQVARAIGFRVLYNDLRTFAPSLRHGAEPVSAEDLFARSDVITLHIDGRPDNRRFVNASLIRHMRPEALLLNTCRGFVLDHEALADFLRMNPGAQALLDVHEPEPFTADHPLLGMRNAHLAPHLASRTRSAMDRMSWVVRDAVAVLEGRTPEFAA